MRCQRSPHALSWDPARLCLLYSLTTPVACKDAEASNPSVI